MSANKVVFRFVSISFSILVLLVVFIGVFKASTFCYDFGYRIFSESPVAAEPGTDVVVQIDEGDSAFDVGKKLEEKGLIRDSKLYVAQYYLSAYAEDGLLPGTYTLNTSMVAKEMMDVMSTPVEDTEAESE
ncbi:MAG: endolytic transglycosylase MltG [Roseburia sp.]|nr:endolytic transglycosylase MltG [Roseburia sp.]